METIDASFFITLKHTNLLTSSNNPSSKYKKHNLSIYKSCLNENLFLNIFNLIEHYHYSEYYIIHQYDTCIN